MIIKFLCKHIDYILLPFVIGEGMYDILHEMSFNE